MSTRHNDFLNDKEIKIIKDMVFKSIIAKDCFEQNELKLIKNSKSVIYEEMDDNLDRLYEYVLNDIDEVLKEAE